MPSRRAPIAILGTAISLDRRGHARVRCGDQEFLARGPVPGDVIRGPRPAQGSTLGAWVLVRGAPERRSPPCAVEAACGGCRLMCLAATGQRSVHLERIRRAFAEYQLALASRPLELEQGPVLGYRNRIRVRADASGTLAFFNPQKALSCSVLDLELQACLAGLSGRRLPGLEQTASIELRTRDLDGRFGAYIVPAKDCSPLDVEAIQKTLGQEFVVGFPGIPAAATQRFALPEGLFFEAPLGSFIQVNFAMNHRLVAWVTERVLAAEARSFWDLFCGVGNFSLPLLKRGLVGVGVEVDARAVAAASRASALQGLGGQFVSGSVQSWLDRSHSEPPDVIILDAPRAGVGASLRAVSELARKALVLVSCCPETLARDVNLITKAGWALTQIQAFDMFPQTHHVEVGVVLIRT